MSDNAEISKALAAVRDNPLGNDPPRWAPFDEYTCAFIRNPYGGHVAQFRTNTERDYAIAAVNSAPVLAAEVERLTALLAAARVAVEALPELHEFGCRSGQHGGRCDCNALEYKTEIRRAVGLEG